VVDVEEGAPEFFCGAAGLAEAGAGGQIEHPDADRGEEQQAGDPDMAGDLGVFAIALSAGDEEAGDQGYEEGERSGEDLGRCGVGVGMGEGNDAPDSGEEEDREERVEGKPECVAYEVADAFVRRGFEFLGLSGYGHAVVRVSHLAMRLRRNDGVMPKLIPGVSRRNVSCAFLP